MRFGKRLARGLKKGVRAVHNVTHKGPIAKARKAVAGVIKKIPVAKQFVQIGEFSSEQIHKGMAKVGLADAEKKRKKGKASAAVKNTHALLKAAKKLPAGVKGVAHLAMASSALVDKKLRAQGALTRPRHVVKKAAAKAAKHLAHAAKHGVKGAAKGLALAAAAKQVDRGAPPSVVRETLKAGGAMKSGATYEVRNLATGKVTRVTL